MYGLIIDSRCDLEFNIRGGWKFTSWGFLEALSFLKISNFGPGLGLYAFSNRYGYADFFRLRILYIVSYLQISDLSPLINCICIKI